jgi:hypothetical protein
MAKMVDGKIQEVFLQMFLQTNPLIKRIESTRLPPEPKVDQLAGAGLSRNSKPLLTTTACSLVGAQTRFPSGGIHESYIYIHIYIYIHTQIYVYIHTHSYTYAYTHTHAYINQMICVYIGR